MDRKDWLVPLLAAVIGIMGTLGGSLVAGYQHERAIARQAQLDIAKQQAAALAEELNTLKRTGLRYMTATDALVNQLVFANARDKALADQLALVQSASNELVLMADDELTRQTLALNQTLARLLMPKAQPMEERLAELNLQVVDWIKQFKRSLEVLRVQHGEALVARGSVQVSAQLQR
jgi:hypothetical protein